MATAKNGKLGLSLFGNIERLCPGAKVPNPAKFLPWGTKGIAVSAVKCKKKLENGAENAMYLRRKGTDLYQIWLPDLDTVETTRILDFILPSVKRDMPENKHCGGEQSVDRNTQETPAANSEKAEYDRKQQKAP